MSVYEASITNPKKQLEFYKDLSEQLQQENQKQKEVIDKALKLLESQPQDMMGNYYFDDNIAEKLLIILKEEE